LDAGDVKKLAVILLGIFLSAVDSTLAQGFINMDFEDSIVANPGQFGATGQVPGWTEYNGFGDSNYSGGTTLIYNDRPVDDPGVCLEGSDSFIPAIDGQYSIFLFGGDVFTSGAAIGQTGQIPLGTQSIEFLATTDDLQVSFNGNPIPVAQIGSGSGYITMGGDISTYAGQTGQLLFFAPTGSDSQEVDSMLDDIQFSSMPVPEPKDFTLGAIGLGLAVFRRRKN
jgi:hypothetical protein